MIKRISGTGCCLLDSLYTNIDFSSSSFRSFVSREAGDGGLVPGQLVFASGLADFAGKSEAECLARLTGGLPPDSVNMGGPGVVAMVHASQLLSREGWDVGFAGILGDDDSSDELRSLLQDYPLNFREKNLSGEPAASTTVLSDPRYNNGKGERTFINRLGAADSFVPDFLGDDFFDAPLFLWGGTGLVPPLHRELTSLVKRAKDGGGINVVGTVYDFHNESRNPHAPWPLGDPDEPAYPWIDLLITDQEEAYRLSGADSLEGAASFFKEAGCKAFIITRGPDPLCLFSSGGVFSAREELYLPVSPYVNADLEIHPEKRGDTTGCGDNFVGGVMVSLARQMEKDDALGMDLTAAAVEGICAGGLALYTKGGCRKETVPGEKDALLEPIREDYLSRTLQEVLG